MVSGEAGPGVFFMWSMRFSFARIPSFVVFEDGGWRWQVSSPGILEPWFGELSHPALGYLKDLPHRKVFPVRDRRGGRYVVKQSLPCTFLSRLQFRFRHPLYREFRILGRLDEERIPCIRPVGYGCSDSQEILITEALPDCVTALEFWHALAPADPAGERAFLHEYAALLKQLKDGLYLHRDLHPENVLYRKPTGKLYLVDPYKLSHCRRPSRLQDLLLCNSMHFLAGRLADQRLTELILEAGLAADRPAAVRLLEDTRRRRRCVSIQKYRKRKRRILAGESQYARVAAGDGFRLHVRNTPWNAPQDIDLRTLRPRRLPAPEARTAWVDSILLPEDAGEGLPLAWREQTRPGEDDVLYYAGEEAPRAKAP